MFMKKIKLCRYIIKIWESKFGETIYILPTITYNHLEDNSGKRDYYYLTFIWLKWRITVHWKKKWY